MAETRARDPAEDGDHEGLARTFHEKVISLDSMDLRLLLPTAVGIAVVVASAVLVATRDLAWPLVSTGSAPVLGTVPLPVATLAAITLAIAWSFVLAGALHAHLALRVVAVGIYAAAGMASAVEAASDSLVTALVVAVIVLSVVVAAAGLYLTDRGNHRQAPHLHHRTALRLGTFGWILLATTLLYASLALSGLRTGTLAQFMDLQLTAFSVLLAPVLVLAGTDFAEWAEVVSGRLGSLLEKLPRRALPAAAAMAAAGVLIWNFAVQRDGLWWTLGTLVPVGVLAIPVAGTAVLSLRRPTSTRVPFWALVAGAVVLYSGLLGGTAIDQSARTDQIFAATEEVPPLVAATSRGDPGYWLLVPQGWSQTEVPGGRMWSGSLAGRPARLVLLWGPLDTRRALSSALATPVETRRDGSAGGWSAFSARSGIAGRTAAGELWTRRQGGRTWAIAGIGTGLPARASDLLFGMVRDSWTSDPAAGGVESSPSPDLLHFLPGTGAAAIVLLALGAALLVAGRGEVATGGLFLTLCGLFSAAGPWVAGAVVQLVGGDPDAQTVGTLNLLVGAACAALAGVALMALIPAWRLPRPVLRLLLVLLLGLVCLQVLREGVFGTAESAGARFSVIAAVVLVAAMLWDVLMSGESFTNRGGLSVPRHTRVLIYLGYTLIVVAAVLFLGAERVQGGGTLSYDFASELWPQVGIETLGPPLLLTFFLVNLAAWRRGRPTGRADGLDQVDRSVLDEVAG